MIILHSEHDKVSRDFVEKYGSDNTVYNYEESLSRYNCISGFPSVVIHVPAYYRADEVFESDAEDEFVIPGGNVEEHDEIIFNPVDIQSMIDLQKKYNELAISSPTK